MYTQIEESYRKKEDLVSKIYVLQRQNTAVKENLARLKLNQSNPQLQNLYAYEQECKESYDQSSEHSRIIKILGEIHNQISIIEQTFKDETVEQDQHHLSLTDEKESVLADFEEKNTILQDSEKLLLVANT